MVTRWYVIFPGFSLNWSSQMLTSTDNVTWAGSSGVEYFSEDCSLRYPSAKVRTTRWAQTNAWSNLCVYRKPYHIWAFHVSRAPVIYVLLFPSYWNSYLDRFCSFFLHLRLRLVYSSQIAVPCWFFRVIATVAAMCGSVYLQRLSDVQRNSGKPTVADIHKVENVIVVMTGCVFALKRY